MSTPQLVVHRDKELMAQAAAARLITKIVDAQASRGYASIVLTGGRNGNGLLAALAGQPARDAIDWGRLDLWWGDERFLPEGDPERNVTQAREALLDAVPLDPKRVHAMPASDGLYGNDVEAAAAGYAEELARAAGPETMKSAAGAADGSVPTFDVLMLGVGPDTHVASLFPELPAVRETERTVVGVHGAPKPPPIRVTLTLPAIRSAREVWLLAAEARTRPRPRRSPCRARVRSRHRPPVPRAAPAPCGCSTRRRHPSCPARCTRLPPDTGAACTLPKSPFDLGRTGSSLSQRPRSSRYLATRAVVDASSPGTSAPSVRAGSTRLARTLPSSTPHWSKESMFQTAPWTNTLCSYSAINCPRTEGSARGPGSSSWGGCP